MCGFRIQMGESSQGVVGVSTVIKGIGRQRKVRRTEDLQLELPRQSRPDRRSYAEVTLDLGGNHEIVRSWKSGKDPARKQGVVISLDHPKSFSKIKPMDWRTWKNW